VLVPLERGGKAGLFGGAELGKTVLLTEMIHNMIGHQEGHLQQFEAVRYFTFC
jgi:F-type H+-transporting ATPase subunit beta